MPVESLDPLGDCGLQFSREAVMVNSRSKSMVVVYTNSIRRLQQHRMVIDFLPFSIHVFCHPGFLETFCFWLGLRWTKMS